LKHRQRIKTAERFPVVQKSSVRRLSNGPGPWRLYTDAQGRFTVPNLAPGNYHVVFESDSYQATVYRTLALEAGSRGTIETVLESPGFMQVALTAYPTYSEFGVLATVSVRQVEWGGADRFERRKDMAMRAVANGAPGEAPPPPMAAPMSRTEACRSGEEDHKKGADKQEGGAEPRRAEFLP